MTLKLPDVQPANDATDCLLNNDHLLDTILKLTWNETHDVHGSIISTAQWSLPFCTAILSTCSSVDCWGSL